MRYNYASINALVLLFTHVKHLTGKGDPMTLQQLTYAIEIEKCQSINKAASNLYLDQSNLGRAITQLEEELGIKIFERNKKGVAVTEKGREFLNYSKEVVDKLKFIEDTYAVRNRLNREYLSISSMRALFLSHPVARLIEKRPPDGKQLYLRLKKQSFQDVLDDVENGHSEIGIIFVTSANVSRLSRFSKIKNLEFHEIGESRMHVIVRDGHPIIEGQAKKDIIDHPYVIAEPVENFGRMYDESSHSIVEMFEKEPSIIISTNDSLISQTIVAESDSFFISSTYWQEPEYFAFNSITLKGTDNTIRHFYVLKKNQLPSRLVEQYIDELKKTVETLKHNPIFD